MVFLWRYGSQAEYELGMVFWIALVQPVLFFVPFLCLASYSSGYTRLEQTFDCNSVLLTDVGRGLRFQHKFLSGPILGSMAPKPPPSKWDDAEKWIASPGHQESPAQTQHRPAQNLLTGAKSCHYFKNQSL